MSTSQAQTIRRFVLTGSIAAITATGAWYGAGLKTRQEFKQEKKKRLEADPMEQIEQLENLKLRLSRQKKELEKKMAEIAARAGNGTGNS